VSTSMKKFPVLENPDGNRVILLSCHHLANERVLNFRETVGLSMVYTNMDLRTTHTDDGDVLIHVPHIPYTDPIGEQYACVAGPLFDATPMDDRRAVAPLEVHSDTVWAWSWVDEDGDCFLELDPPAQFHRTLTDTLAATPPFATMGLYYAHHIMMVGPREFQVRASTPIIPGFRIGYPFGAMLLIAGPAFEESSRKAFGTPAEPGPVVVVEREGMVPMIVGGGSPGAVVILDTHDDPSLIGAWVRTLTHDEMIEQFLPETHMHSDDPERLDPQIETAIRETMSDVEARAGVHGGLDQ
jgi:hypothetical protein